MRKVVAVLLLGLLLGGVAFMGGLEYVKRFGQRPIALPQPLAFQIPPGSSFRAVVARLQGEGVIDETLLFRLFARNRQATGRIQAGEYLLAPGISHQQLLDTLVSGKVLQHQVTLVEGQRLRDFLLQLQQQEALVFDLAEPTQEAVAKLLGLDATTAEGWIYPDTYHFPRGTKVSALLLSAYQRMQQVLAQEWAQRGENLPLKSAYEALILASIIEKETAVAAERSAIAGVFVRRLQRGMRLQTDPTVIYGMGERYEGGINRADLRRKTPYNTYVIKGLPPTPIANPARAAIHAALHPEDGKALYFVARGDGTHQFSSTLAEHNRAVERYQRSGRRSDYRSAPAVKQGAES